MAVENLIPNDDKHDIPWQMMNMRNWVAFTLTQGNNKLDKKPINPHDLSGAKANDSSTWGSYAEAVEAAKKLANRNILGYGIGFEFGESGEPSGIAGIDIDHCINEKGELSELAKNVVSEFRAYTEISPSGTGLHLFFKITKSLRELRPDLFSESSGGTGKKNDKLGIEIYDSGRFLTMTGLYHRDIDNHALQDRTAQVKDFLDKYFPQSQPQPQPTQQAVMSFTPPDKSNSELWEVMFNSQEGEKIKRLYSGDISGYTSIHKDGKEYIDSSSADLALCRYLAFYTGRDYSRIEGMMNESALGAREKWRARPDYRQRTISQAIASTNEIYTGKQESQQIPAMLQEVEAPSQPLAQISFSFSADYLDSAFDGDMENFKKYSGRKTGFSNLDGEYDKYQKLNLYPGLYVFGAISSLGKTTFNLQLADNLASMGEHVLFFAFEQSRFELVSKSLARLCQPEGAFYESSPSALRIREGYSNNELQEAKRKYREIAKHHVIVECDFEYNVSMIIETIHAYIQQYGVKPVVFIDYLQLVRSDDKKLTSPKDIVDDVLRKLKQFQKQNEIVMFVISSLNRQNYLTTIDFESLKESGAIEYTADVVIGMQLAIMGSPFFENSHTPLNKKRDAVKAAKRENPRRIEMQILKNRYGISNMAFYFNYYSKWDLFTPATLEDMMTANEDLLLNEDLLSKIDNSKEVDG